jgi:hypothetical protein
MSSQFRDEGIFNSGPHRFSIGPRGESMVSNLVIGASPSHGTTAQGERELDIVVTGRLVAADESSLWALRDAVMAQLTHPPTTGKLQDHHGTSWTDMSFIEFVEEDRTDRGRVRSVGYKAVFRRIAT